MTDLKQKISPYMAEYEKTKYSAGDVFIRFHDMTHFLCILVSRKFNSIYGRFVWKAIELKIQDGKFDNGETVRYYEEDLDGMFFAGQITARESRLQGNEFTDTFKLNVDFIPNR